MEGKVEGKVDHPMSLAAAAASMRDCRRFESPPKVRSTMSSFLRMFGSSALPGLAIPSPLASTG